VSAVRQIFNGYSATRSPSLGRFCGSQLPAVNASSGSRLVVRFVSNSDGQSSTGFQLNFTDVVLGCGRPTIVLSGDRPTTSVESPNYPNNYPHNVDCTWTVTAPANRKVRLQFVGDIFSIERHPRSNTTTGLRARTHARARAHTHTHTVLTASVPGVGAPT